MPTRPPTPTTSRPVLPKLAPRGLIAADNTLWSGRVLDPSDTSEDTVALRRFNDALAPTGGWSWPRPPSATA